MTLVGCAADITPRQTRGINDTFSGAACKAFEKNVSAVSFGYAQRIFGVLMRWTTNLMAFAVTLGILESGEDFLECHRAMPQNWRTSERAQSSRRLPRYPRSVRSAPRHRRESR